MKPQILTLLTSLAVPYVLNTPPESTYKQTFCNTLHNQIVKEGKAIHEELQKEVTRLDQRGKELIHENARIKKGPGAPR